MIKDVVNIPVTDSKIEVPTIEKEEVTYKVIFDSYVDNDTTKLKILDYNKLDLLGVKTPPIFNIDIQGFYVFSENSSSEILSYDDKIGILSLKNELGSILEGQISELTIKVDETMPNESVSDYIYVRSLHNINRRLNIPNRELYRRFEIGIFCYSDANEDKANYYMEKIRTALDRNFPIYDSNSKEERNKIDDAYITNPLKFEVVEDGKLDRVVYGTIMVQTYI